MREAFERFLKGNADAVDLNIALHEVVHLWDDLIDLDRPVTPADINKAFHHALITIPRNAFYRANFADLSPILESAIFDWLAANEIEKTKDVERLRQAYVLRYTLLSFTVICARIIGGPEWAHWVNVEFRTMASPWKEYIEGLGVTNGLD